MKVKLHSVDWCYLLVARTLLLLLWCQAKKPAAKKTGKTLAKGAGKGVGSKKKKSTLKYTVDCTHPVEDGIMDPGNFVGLVFVT